MKNRIEIPEPLLRRESLLSFTEQALAELMQQYGQPAFRARQLFGWLHTRRCASFDEMTNMPAALRQRLQQQFTVAPLQLQVNQVSSDGTQKMLLQLGDGHCVETVLMQYHYGPSVCVSSQVGCRMGCAFCASTRGGHVRNLSAGEIAAQVYAAHQQAQKRISHVVLMGIGEPMENLDAVLDFISIITSPNGYHLSARNISLSTCGVVPGIRALAEHKLQITLSVSLHAANDELRTRLMPVNRKWPLAELMAACRQYQKHTGRRISFEYAMLHNVNDSDADADALAALLAGMGAHVNLIRANEVQGAPFAPSSKNRTAAFTARLQKAGVNVTLRRRLGSDIDAACGQLRIKNAEKQAQESPCE